MKILFFPEANFRPDHVQEYEYKGEVFEFFAEHKIDKDQYVVVGKGGKELDVYVSDVDCVAIVPKIGKGNVFKAILGVVGVLLAVATGGALAAIATALGTTGTVIHAIGMGIALCAGGSLMMGKMKMPAMDFDTESATRTSYQWNVGSLSTSRGVKGVTFGSDVTPEGELLAYRTYGTSSISGAVSETRYYYGKNKEVTKAQYDAGRAAKSYTSIYFRKETTHTDAYANNDGASWLEMLIGCGEGPLDDITDIKVNGTPIEELEGGGAEYHIRLGTNNQDSLSMTNLDSQIAYQSVNQIMPMKLAGANVPLIVTTPEACDSVIISCQSAGIYITDMSSGNKNRSYYKPVIKYRRQGTSEWTDAIIGIGEIDNPAPLISESAFYFSVKIDFPSNGKYELSFQNCSAELNYQKGAGGLSGALPAVLPDRVQCAITIDNFACYDSTEQSYPGTALIWLKLPASQALNGSVPKVTWKQSRENVIVWNGSSYATKPADNLAWAIYDSVAQIRKDEYNNNYHVEGEAVENIDYAAFSSFAAFCETIDAKGNFFLNKLQSSWETAQDLATSARAFIGLKNGKVRPYWDAPEVPTQMFTVGNYEGFSGGLLSKRDRATTIEATFCDEDDDYKSKTIKVTAYGEAEDENRTTSVSFAGLSNAAGAYKAAQYLLNRNKYLTDYVKFTADIDSIVCELNDVIIVQSDQTLYGVGGRIVEVDTSLRKITLDAVVSLEAGNLYSLLVRKPDGTNVRLSPIETSGSYTQLTFSSSVSGISAGCVYIFGITNLEGRKYRVASITRTNDLKAEIEATEYDENVYTMGTVPDLGYNNPSASINSVTTTVNPESVAIAWQANAATYYVDVYVDGVYYGRYVRGCEIPGINSTQNIELRPVNSFGQPGTSEYASITGSIPVPSQPVAPIIAPYNTGAFAIFDPIPTDEYLTWLVIYEGSTEIARTLIEGETVSVQLQLSGGEEHHLRAFYLNSYNKMSPGRDFIAATSLIQVPDVVRDWIVANVFETAMGVGVETDGVRFDQYGIEGWYDHNLVFDLNAAGESVISGWHLGSDMLYNNNIEINSDGTIRTSDFVSGHNGWSVDGNGKAEFEDVTIRGSMTSVNFVKDTVSAIGGSLMVVSAAEVQSATRTTVSGQNIICENYIDLICEDGSNLIQEASGNSDYYSIVLDDASVFNTEDILRIRNTETVQDLWLGIVSKSGNTINCVMLYGTAIELEAGMCIVNYRKAGNGGIILDGNAPRLDMYTHNGQPWNGTDCWVRLGNIKGINGVTDDRFGIFLGDAGASHSDGHFLQFDHKSGKLRIQGEVVITNGITYNSIVNAQNTANSASTAASSAQSTANTANANANAALAFRNAVANTNYTSIKGGAVTTGIIKNSTYQEPSDQKFSVGSGYDLDHGHIHTPYFYVNDSGAGFKGSIETAAGKINGINIADLVAVMAASKSATSVSSYSGTIKGVNGYLKFSNKVMIQFGLALKPSGTSSVDVAIQTMPDTTYLVFLTIADTAGGGLSPYPTTKTTSKFTVALSTGNAVAFYWIVIGIIS